MGEIYKQILTWDRGTRLFHWVNVLCFLGLLALGTVLMNEKALGVSTEGKILLKQWHVWIGYVFAVNLGWRIIWGFIGGQNARWRKILPFSRDFVAELKAYLSGRRRDYPGHNPLGRLMVTALVALLLVQASTGLLLAATDLYQGPFGAWVAGSVAAEGTEPASLKPYDKTGIDEQRFQAMRTWRAVVVETHEIVFFVLLGLVFMHVMAVVLAEIREGGGLVSAMITGRRTVEAGLSPPQGEKSRP